jgi:hypothetical protein
MALGDQPQQVEHQASSQFDTEKQAKPPTLYLTDSRADRYFGEAQVSLSGHRTWILHPADHSEFLE